MENLCESKMEGNDPINVRVCVTKLIPAILIVLPLLAMVTIIILMVASQRPNTIVTS